MWRVRAENIALISVFIGTEITAQRFCAFWASSHRSSRSWCLPAAHFVPSRLFWWAFFMSSICFHSCRKFSSFLILAALKYKTLSWLRIKLCPRHATPSMRYTGTLTRHCKLNRRDEKTGSVTTTTTTFFFFIFLTLEEAVKAIEMKQ